MRTDNKAVTPTLAETIQTLIDSNLINLHVCLPAKIVKYDSSTQYADVLPSLMKKYEDGTILPWPVIPNIPVVFPRAVSGAAYLHMPITVGDDVTLVICERSLDNWKQTGMLSDPNDRRKFNIGDAFAIPGGSGEPLAFHPVSKLAVELANALSILSLLPTGETTLGNSIGKYEVTPTGTANIKAPLVNVGQGASHGIGLGDVIEARLSALENAFATLTTTFGLHVHNIIAPAPGSPVGPPLPPATPFVPVPTPAASVTAKVST